MQITLVESHAPELAPWLMGYLGAELSAGHDPIRRVIPARPNCFIQIILSGHHTLVDVLSDQRVGVPAVGLFGPLTHHRYDMEITGHLRTFCARLRPAAAGYLFAVDPGSLVDNFVLLDAPHHLLEDLRASADWQAMAVRVDNWLGELARHKALPDSVAQAASMQRDSRGTTQIQELVDRAGLSARQFQRRFLALTGLNPKHYARLCRVSHAVHLKQVVPGASWTRIATECGYCDQAHFIRDFKALLAKSPRKFLSDDEHYLREPKWQD